ncbi:MAG TPA: hypothetical protein VMZ31_04820 [Phycisphaerae bacterium]|nr:hypothetical protein [Phycisphaerae bacterium]
MSMQIRVHARKLAGLATLALAAVVITVAVGPSAFVVAADPAVATVIRVEEDWKLVLTEPDNIAESPQFHTIMAPSTRLDYVCLQSTWNYHESPDYIPGGLQLQVWRGDDCVFAEGFLTSRLLSIQGETITWTQALSTDGHFLRFEVLNGNSATWGTFGGSTMRLVGNIQVPSLNGYTPDMSMQNSGVTYGANRVIVLAITGVRYYGTEGLLYEDYTHRVVVAADAN